MLEYVKEDQPPTKDQFNFVQDQVLNQKKEDGTRDQIYQKGLKQAENVADLQKKATKYEVSSGGSHYSDFHHPNEEIGDE